MNSQELLANWLECNLDELTETYNGNVFETSSGEEYLVLEESEVSQYVQDDIESLMDDLGLDTFTPHFQDWILEHACYDSGWFEDVFRESEESYAYDLENESATSDEFNNRLEEEMAEASVDNVDDFVEYLLNQIASDGDFIQAFKDVFGDGEFREVCVSRIRFDYKKIADECIAADGAGHFLSGYDGNEIDLGNGYYAYRLN